MQVLLGSLTTGLSALAVTGGRSVNNFFLNGIYGLPDTMARFIIISLKTAAATTALGTLFLKKKNLPFQLVPWPMSYYFLNRCFGYFGSFISCSCKGFKRTRTIYYPYQRSRAVYQRMSIVSIGLRALIWARI